VKDTSLLADKKIHSANPNREVTLVRTSVGVGALFTPFNSPFVLVTGKLFPALLCGNAVVLKAHELAPYAPILAVRLFIEAGVPADLIAVLQGGADVGEMVVTDPRVQFVSFTGSSRGGASILATTAPRLTRVSIEAGGKNPMVICADADLDKALADATASITVDAGQRCASTSRLIIAHEIYEKFRERLIERFATLTGGTRESDTVGAIISEERLQSLLTAVSDVRTRGAVVTYGGERIGTKGFFMQPTILENVSPDDPLSQAELFGPIVILYRVKNLDEAIAIANNSPYRLSSAIHTQDMQKAARFAREHGAGVTRINGPTFGSESHMPFGGEGLSGNGWREPGVEALNFYSSLRQVSFDNGASIR
jgi:aldehyde dehydrogenase (NAD+)